MLRKFSNLIIKFLLSYLKIFEEYKIYQRNIIFLVFIFLLINCFFIIYLYTYLKNKNKNNLSKSNKKIDNIIIYKKNSWSLNHN